MTLIDREKGRTIFGENPERYTEGRPEYPARIYEILRTTCQIGPQTNAFEVGSGTGQATLRLLEDGCRVAAIEPDARLAAVLSKRVPATAVSQLSLYTVPFEAVELPDASFDLGVAATSLHWLDAKTALSKAIRLLRPGGWWAMWWTVFGDPNNEDEFQRRTHPLFRDLEASPSREKHARVPFALDAEQRQEELASVGFEAISAEVIRWTSRLTTKQVVSLTATFSPVANLSQDKRSRFLEDIERIVNEDFGGIVTRNFVTAIYTASRPST